MRRTILLVITVIAFVHGAVLVPEKSISTPVIEPGTKNSQTELEPELHKKKQGWVLPGQNADDDDTTVKIVYDLEVGDRGIMAIRDDTLGACFINHYFEHFHLPYAQREFYIKHLPSTMAKSEDDENFQKTVGPNVASHCSDLLSYWLDQDLFYRFSTRNQKQETMDTEKHSGDSSEELPEPIPQSNIPVILQAKKRRNGQVLSPNILQPAEIIDGQSNVPVPPREPKRVQETSEQIRIPVPIPNLKNLPIRVPIPNFLIPRKSLEPKPMVPVPHISNPKPIPEFVKIPVPMPKMLAPEKIREPEQVAKSNEQLIKVPLKIRQMPVPEPEIPKELFPIPPRKIPAAVPPLSKQ